MTARLNSQVILRRGAIRSALPPPGASPLFPLRLASTSLRRGAACCAPCPHHRCVLRPHTGETLHRLFSGPRVLALRSTGFSRVPHPWFLRVGASPSFPLRLASTSPRRGAACCAPCPHDLCVLCTNQNSRHSDRSEESLLYPEWFSRQVDPCTLAPSLSSPSPSPLAARHTPLSFPEVRP